MILSHVWQILVMKMPLAMMLLDLLYVHVPRISKEMVFPVKVNNFENLFSILKRILE